jgi:uncharacterized membrane protein
MSAILDFSRPVRSDRSIRLSEHAVRPMPDPWWLSVWIITLAALALRLALISCQSFWYDEVIAAWLSEQSYWDLLTGRQADLGNPPLYWMVLRFFATLLGRSDVAYRFPAVLFGTALVPLLGFFGRQLFNARVGLWCAGLAAVAPMSLELSLENRTFTMLAALATANAWYFLRFVRRYLALDGLLYVMTLYLACMSHYYALGLPVIHGTALLLGGQRSGKTWLAWLGLLVVTGLLWSAWLPTFLWQFRSKLSPDSAPLEGDWVIQFASTPQVFGLSRAFAWKWSPRWMLAVGTLGSLATFWLLAGLGLWRLRSDRFLAWFLGSWLVLPILGPFLVALTVKPLYSTRYAFLGFPAFVLLIGLGLDALRPRVRSFMVVTIGILIAVAVLRYAFMDLKSDWRSAIRYVSSRAVAEDLFLFDTDIQTEPFLFYAERNLLRPRRMIGLLPGIGEDRLLYGATRDRRAVFDGPRDVSADVLGEPRLWLALCETTSMPERYESYFRKRGYRHEISKFHNITIIQFIREHQE